MTYWNAFVANLEMHGKGTLYDPRLNDPAQFPVAARAGFGNTRNSPDLITPKLVALHFYQLAIPAPKPPDGSFDAQAAGRGEAVFNGRGCQQATAYACLQKDSTGHEQLECHAPRACSQTTS